MNGKTIALVIGGALLVAFVATESKTGALGLGLLVIILLGMTLRVKR